MASEAFDAESEQKRPTVQVGDPFTEKVLLEACLEAMRTGAIVAIQDMGAAGLTSSTFEMAGRGGTGIRLDLDRVPLREPGLTPYEMMLSESQERMVLVAQRGREEELERVFRALGPRGGDDRRGHGRPAAPSSTWRGERRGRHADRAAHRGGAGLPPPGGRARRPRGAPGARPRCRSPTTSAATLERLLATPDFASKEWIWRQYDYTVRTNTVQGPGGDAAVLLLKGTPSGLAMTSDVNPVYC